MDLLGGNVVANVEDLISETSKCRIAAQIETCLIVQCHVGKDHVLFSSILRQEYCRSFSHNEDNKRDRRGGDSREKELSKTMHATPCLPYQKPRTNPAYYSQHPSPRPSIRITHLHYPTQNAPAHHPPPPPHSPPPSIHHSPPRSPAPTPPQPSD